MRCAKSIGNTVCLTTILICTFTFVANVRAKPQYVGCEGTYSGTNIMTKIKDNLPNSATSFFSRAISSQLNEDTKSITQMKEILAGQQICKQLVSQMERSSFRFA